MKIITLTPNQVDATSFYRAWGVFPDIMKRSDITFTDYYDAQMMLGEGKRGFTWANALQYDAAFFQRAFGNVIEIAKFMKDCGLKIIYELDDNLWEIPNSFDIKRFYDKDKLSTMVYMLKISDLVIVSTQALADYISTAFDVKCEVVNNAIDLNKYPIQPYKVARQVAQGESIFDWKVWDDAWDGRDLYDNKAIAEAENTFGKAKIYVAKGLLEGKKPGEILEAYGDLTPEITAAIEEAFNNPDSFN